MERTLFPLIVDTIKRYEMIWDAMGKSDGVFDVLMKKVIHNELLYYRVVMVLKKIFFFFRTTNYEKNVQLKFALLNICQA